MHVSRIGFTALKGARHLTHEEVELTRDGPVGDRVFALVDRGRRRVLRTIENPTLMTSVARWDGEQLTVRLGGGQVAERPRPTGERLAVDYWGRTLDLQVQDGPWAAAYSDLLGAEVVLARAARPGQIVYGQSVSLVTTSSLERLARETGTPVDGAAFRVTFTVETAGAPPHVEDGWIGGTLKVGSAELRVHRVVARCAVVDRDPDSGRPGVRALSGLGRYRRHLGEIGFGVDAVVTCPGRVRVGATVERG